MEITVAGNSHNCQANAGHRIVKGMKRLTIKSDGNKENYCLACAKSFMVRDVERLRSILAEVDNSIIPAGEINSPGP
jgi:hypothetical protein